MSEDERQEIRQRLNELRIEHRDLDEVISHLVDNPSIDQLRLRRLKKKKLQLKDMITRLESQMIPDMDA